MELQPNDDPIQTLTSGVGSPTATITAAQLIGVRAVPAGLSRIKELALESRAYHVMDPYPFHHFRDWKTEDRGPLPRCLPVARGIVGRGASWLFSRAPQITVPGNATFETFLKSAWRAERMPARLVAMAKEAALDGGIVLKFAYDSKRKPQPLSISALSLIDQARLYYDPHDCENLLMARVQYRYFDAIVGRTYWYREEWTAEEEVHYFPLPDDQLGTTKFRKDPDTFEGWTISSRAANPFGLIPCVHIKNLETDDAWGVGDCWDLYRILDRINLTFHLMDKSNQFDSEPMNVFLDVELDEHDIDQPLSPGQDLQLHTTPSADGTGQQGKVIPIEHAGRLRPAMMEYAKALKSEVMAAASSIEVDQAEFTNKGNLTVAVLQQIYLPLIRMTEMKRKVWGGDEECDGGLTSFFATIGQGLTNLGVSLGVTDDPDSYTAALGWHPFFQASEDEKTASVGRLQEEEVAGYVTHERAIEEVARIEGRDDVQQLKEDLEEEAAAKAKADADAAAASATETAPGLGPDALPPDVSNVGKDIQTLNREAGKDGL
jgi:hypothetical protein